MKTQPLDELLREHPFFRGLDPAYLALIAGCAQNARFNAGQFIFHEGDESSRFYIIRHGKVALQTSGAAAGTITILTLAEGEILGWSWLIPPHRKQFDARAIDLVRAIAIDGACLRQKCDDDPKLGYELLKRFAAVVGQRLQATRLQLLDVYATQVG